MMMENPPTTTSINEVETKTPARSHCVRVSR